MKDKEAKEAPKTPSGKKNDEVGATPRTDTDKIQLKKMEESRAKLRKKNKKMKLDKKILGFKLENLRKRNYVSFWRRRGS